MTCTPAQAELRVLVADRVEAVRAGGDDGRDPVLGMGGRQRRDVLLGEHLEEVLVAGAPSRVAGAGLARAEHGERHVGLAQQLGHRPHDLAIAIVEGAGAADPEQDAAVERVGHRCGGSKIVRQGVPPPLESRRGAHRPRPAPATSRPFAQSRRADFGWPHGLPAFSMLRNAALSSFGKRALLQHRVAADLDDRVDVLDQHRAALDAPAAGRALPDRLLGDGVVDQRQGQRLLRALPGQVRARPPTPPPPRSLRPSTPAAPMRPPPAPSPPPGSGRACPPSGASGAASCR